MTKPNRLAQESSPYLLQHAHNPVDWYPWGEEAFAKAREQNKLVFLSVGYATCHWCHVMERESFENAEIAALMNKHLVCIKVDREERPDIDNVYMRVTQAMTGQGGWPMSVFMTPDKHPVYAGTYFPPSDRYGRMGFPSLIRRLSELWEDRRDDLLQQGERVLQHLKQAGEREATKGEINDAAFVTFSDSMLANYDARHGGFFGAPKFPTTHRVQVLLRHAHATGDDKARHAALHTLRAMADGGIHDHVGGGFHRYATDVSWLVPHFEKMLYDQALLLEAYLDAFELTGDSAYSDVARDIVTYVLRDMTDERGGFYSAEDADSEGEEGKFYVWSADELCALLGDDADVFMRVYGCRDEGNWTDEATREVMTTNILHLPVSMTAASERVGVDETKLREQLAGNLATLLDERSKRVRPLLDDKILTDWNGLMIGAMARAGSVLDEADWIDAATRAADFVLSTMMDDGRLLHRFRRDDAGNEHAGIRGFSADYAYLLNGLWELHQATQDPRWAQEAATLTGEMLRLFADESGLMQTQGRDETDRMISDHIDSFDGATPSASSAAALALVRWGKTLRRTDWIDASHKILTTWGQTVMRAPSQLGYGLLALEWLVRPVREVVLAGDDDAMLAEARRGFTPRTLVLVRDEALFALVDGLEVQGPVDGKPTAYVCENFACKAPVVGALELRKELDGA